MTSLRESLGLSGGGVVSLVGAGGKTTLLFRLARELSIAGDPVMTTTTTRILVPTLAESPAVILAESPDRLREEAPALLARAGHFTAAPCKTGAAGEKLSGYAPEAIDTIHALRIVRWVLVEADGAARRPLKAPDPHEPVVPCSSGWVIAMVGLDSIGEPLGDQSVFRPERFVRISGLAMGAPVDPKAIANAIAHGDGLLKGAPEKTRRIVFLNKADSDRRIAAAREIADRLAGAHRAAPLRRIRIVVGNAASDPPIIEYRDV